MFICFGKRGSSEKRKRKKKEKKRTIVTLTFHLFLRIHKAKKPIALVQIGNTIMDNAQHIKEHIIQYYWDLSPLLRLLILRISILFWILP